MKSAKKVKQEKQVESRGVAAGVAFWGGGQQRGAAGDGRAGPAEAWLGAFQAEGPAWEKAAGGKVPACLRCSSRGRGLSWVVREEDQRAISWGQSCGPGRTWACMLDATEPSRVFLFSFVFLHVSVQSFISL